MKQFCDAICIYDDGSTDTSVEVASRYTKHILLGATNNYCKELFHKNDLLQYSLNLQPDFLWWQDADEILDRRGTAGGLRALAEESHPDTVAFGFRELNLWRSQTYYRTDGLFSTAWFIRLWRVIPGMHIAASEGLDRPSYPCHIKTFTESDIKVIHYHFCDYKRLLWSSGLGLLSRAEFQERAKGNFMLDESDCTCHRLPEEWYPVENVPAGEWPEPRPQPIASLLAYSELP